MTDDEIEDLAGDTLAIFIAALRLRRVPDATIAAVLLGSACFVAKGAIADEEWAQLLDMAQAKSLGRPVNPTRN